MAPEMRYSGCVLFLVLLGGKRNSERTEGLQPRVCGNAKTPQGLLMLASYYKRHTSLISTIQISRRKEAPQPAQHLRTMATPIANPASSTSPDESSSPPPLPPPSRFVTTLTPSGSAIFSPLLPPLLRTHTIPGMTYHEAYTLFQPPASLNLTSETDILSV